MLTTRFSARPFLLVLIFACAAWRTNAAPPADDRAKVRAASYQAEARTIFSRRNWRITRDKPGTLTAEHYIGFPLGAGTVMEALLDTNTTGVAQVMVTFQPKSVTDTACVANLRRYNYSQSRNAAGQYALTGPYPVTNPDMLKAVSEVLEKAHQRLLAAHPEYAAK